MKVLGTEPKVEGTLHRWGGGAWAGPVRRVGRAGMGGRWDKSGAGQDCGQGQNG